MLPEEETISLFSLSLSFSFFFIFLSFSFLNYFSKTEDRGGFPELNCKVVDEEWTNLTNVGNNTIRRKLLFNNTSHSILLRFVYSTRLVCNQVSYLKYRGKEKKIFRWWIKWYNNSLTHFQDIILFSIVLSFLLSLSLSLEEKKKEREWRGIKYKTLLLFHFYSKK